MVEVRRRLFTWMAEVIYMNGGGLTEVFYIDGVGWAEVIYLDGGGYLTGWQRLFT